IQWAPLSFGVMVTQKEKFIAIQNGNEARIPCEHDDKSYITVLWYQQKAAERQLQLVATSTGVNSSEIEKELQTRYSISSMSAVDLRTQDTANYFCPLVTVTNNKVYFGAGTKLTVLEDGLNITSPKVAIFPPSKQEIKEKGKATLVCLVRDFYPDHVKLVWQVNDADREDGVRTDEFSTWDDTSKSYSLTSRLRISTQEWFNSKNSFRCAVKFHLDEVQYEVIRGGDGE
uniref:Ig-like domain-containing protein n=1 Tax=Chelonoidis abingdonii TaxID=106734 RepID=A0A8C0H7R9_CHEAB